MKLSFVVMSVHSFSIFFLATLSIFFRAQAMGVADPMQAQYAEFSNACRSGILARVKELGDQLETVDIACPGLPMTTPLMVAVEAQQEDVVGYLLEKNALVCRTNADGLNVLHGALTRKPTLSMVQMLLKSHKSCQAHGSNGISVKYLMESCDSAQNTPLHEAAHHGSPELLRYLFAEGFEHSKRNARGATPFNLAVQSNTTEAVKVFLCHGRQAFIEGSSWGHFFGQLGYGPIESYPTDLSDKRIAINMHVTCAGNHLFQAALEKIGRLDYKKSPSGLDCRTREHFGLYVRYNKDFNLALSVDVRDQAGNTPLHYAVQGGKIALVGHLLSRGANPLALNDAGFTPLGLSVNNGMLKIFLGAAYGVQLRI